MTEAIPSSRGQSLPRAFGLAPDGLPVPAATLRVLLERGRPLDLICRGFVLYPWVRDGGSIRVDPGARPGPGDLVLCESDGWADVRRVIRRGGDGQLWTALDPFPRGREAVPPARVLGVVRGVRGFGDLPGWMISRGFPLWSRIAALLFRGQKVAMAPCFGARAPGSVQEKYAQQVEGYSTRLAPAIEPEILAQLQRRLTPGGSLLIAGSGAGGEVLHFARAGYRVTGFDFVPAMVDASRRNIAAAGLHAELLVADMVTLDLPRRNFEAACVTPLVYSFVQGRGRRIEALRRLGRHLAPGGVVVFSAHLFTSPAQWLEVLLVWIRCRRRSTRVEFGDWYTWFPTPRGTIGTSFTHRFFARQVMAEARAAGFGRVERTGRGHFIAREYRP
jgi:SAM-dependent methyltransferase